MLRDVRIVDGLGGAPIEHGAVVIEGTQIRAVGRDDEVRIPEGATTVTLTGKTVLPGLVSTHAHLGMTNGTTATPANATRDNVLRQLRQYEDYGVTTVTSLGLNGNVFLVLRDEAHAGRAPGADLFGADRGIGVRGGAPPVESDADHLARVDDPEQARVAVRDAATRHPDLVKIWVDDFHGSLHTKMNRDTYRAVIEEAHRLGLRVAAHVYYLADAKALVTDGVDILAHGVRDAPVDDELIALLRAHHTWYVPTLALDESFYWFAQHPELLQMPFVARALQPSLAGQLTSSAWRDAVLGDAAKLATDTRSLAVNQHNLRTLYAAGIPIGFGTDSGATPLRVAGVAEHRELRLMVDAGVPPLAAIRIATSQSAALLGLTDRGAVQAGKLADLLIVEGDPSRHIDDTTNIVAVWHRGRRHEAPLERTP